MVIMWLNVCNDSDGEGTVHMWHSKKRTADDEGTQSMCGIVSNRLPAYGPVAVRGFPNGHNLIFQVSQVSA